MPILPALLLAATLAAAGTAAGVWRAARAMRALYPSALALPGVVEPKPAHDPARLTAAVLLDHAGTEVSDFLLPYELLASSGAFNVYAVAPDYRPVPLTGGLDVQPDLSYAGFNRLPANPELIVVPHLPEPDPRVLDWIHQQAGAGTTVLSICTGAGVLAAAGLLAGRPSTTHWGDLPRLERRYPDVQWHRGVRYVDDGDVAASAGITSGIDATLHLIGRLAGPGPMHRAAHAIGYRDLGYLEDPSAEQFRIELADIIVPLTAAFARRAELGVLLRDGIDETSLAAVMDTHAATFTARLRTVTPDGGPVRSRHGLTLLPRHRADNVAVSRTLVPSTDDFSAPYLAIRDAIHDLAVRRGHPIARFAAKRLEYRTPDLPDGVGGWLYAAARLVSTS